MHGFLLAIGLFSSITLSAEIATQAPVCTFENKAFNIGQSITFKPPTTASEVTGDGEFVIWTCVPFSASPTGSLDHRGKVSIEGAAWLPTNDKWPFDRSTDKISYAL